MSHARMENDAPCYIICPLRKLTSLPSFELLPFREHLLYDIDDAQTLNLDRTPIDASNESIRNESTRYFRASMCLECCGMNA